MNRSATRTIIASTAVAAIPVALMAGFLAWQRHVESQIENSPTATGFEVQMNSVGDSSLVSNARYYTLGNYGVVEFANTRISLRGYARRGSSGNSTVVLATDVDGAGWSSSGGGTGHFFEAIMARCTKSTLAQRAHLSRRATGHSTARSLQHFLK